MSGFIGRPNKTGQSMKMTFYIISVGDKNKMVYVGKQVTIFISHYVENCIRRHLACCTAVDQAKGYGSVQIIASYSLDAKFEGVSWIKAQIPKCSGYDDFC